MAFCRLSPLGLLLLSASLAAQQGGGGAGGGGAGSSGGVSSSSQGTVILPPLNPEMRPLFISGKVTNEDGTLLPEVAGIQTICPGWAHTVGYTDSKGSFSFQLDRNSRSNVGENRDVTDSDGAQNAGNPNAKQFDWRDCQLKALLPGFISKVVDLAPHIIGESRAEVGSIVVHRVGGIDGFTVSATSAVAPPQAKKDYQKGLSLENKNDWVGGQEKFQSAVNLYPKYAEAWVELGRMQAMLNREDEAIRSFHKALDADSRFVPAYQQLAEIGVKEQDWKAVAEFSDQALQLNPASSLRYWLLNAAANFHLNRLDLAQTSATRGMELDTDGRYPKLEYLLGLVLAQKHQYHDAIVHIQNFLRAVPNSSDTENAQKQLRKLETLEAEATQAPR